MATVKLNAVSRQSVGKQGAKHARAEGRVPAVLYGEAQANLPLALDAHDLRVALSTPSGRNVIIQLSVDGGEATRAVIREMSRHPLSRRIIHIDMQRISENKPVVMNIPVVLTGEPLAVKEGRGILDHTMRTLEVRCLPRHIPEHIDVDVSSLEVRQSIHVGDITVPNVEILDNKERPVVEVLQPTLFTETKPGEVAAPAEGEVAEGEEGAEKPAEDEGKKDKKDDKPKKDEKSKKEDRARG
jgi:large subunit ribosomal protein L25